MKKHFVLFLLAIIFALSSFATDNCVVPATESGENYCVNSGSDSSYDVIIEDNVVEYNNEILITFVIGNEIASNEVTILNASFVPLKRIIEQGETIDVYVTNNHDAGEHSFEINVQNNDGLSFTQTIYIYSDGIRDCVSSSCIEESKDIYFCNFIATEEELYILGRLEEIDSNTYTTTYHETIKKYESFVNPNDDISCVATSVLDDVDDKIRITGKIQWRDSANNLQPLIGCYVYLYDTNVFIEEAYGCTKTNDLGEFSFVLDYSTWQANCGMGFFVLLRAMNDVAHVDNVWSFFRFPTQSFLDIEDDSAINYDIIIETNKSNRANSFEIAQMMYYAGEYVKEMTNIALPAVKVRYPSGNSSSYYNTVLNVISLAQQAFEFCDVIMHEYGHYVDDCFDLSPLVGGEHFFDEDLAYHYNKTKGLKLAYSEALATYIGISSQLFYDLSGTSIPTAGDYSYDSYNGATWYGKQSGYGESDEGSIFGLLLAIADDTPGSGYDSVSLGYSELWDILASERRNNVSELIEDIVDLHPDLTNELGSLFEHFGFAPINMISSNRLDFNNTNNVFFWSENRSHVNTVSKLDNFSLRFFSQDLEETYQIDGITTKNYTLSVDDLNNILSFEDNTIYWQVLGYNTNEFRTGPYNSSLIQISKPVVNDIALDENVNSFLFPEETIWYKFVVPKTGRYVFETIGTGDTFGELFASVVADHSEINRFIDGFDDNNGEGLNFKIEYELEYQQVVYLRVRGANYVAVDDFILCVSCVNHEHVYEYVPVNYQYHIRRCHCGVTTGRRLLHVIDSSYIDPMGNGRYKPCLYCGIEIDTWSDIMYPGLMSIGIVSAKNAKCVYMSETTCELSNAKSSEETLLVNGKEYQLLKLLGHGKGGYSYLATSQGALVVVKQIHHEPCSYYTFGNKIQAERCDYAKLCAAGIRVPKLLDIDEQTERIVKEFVQGETVFEMVKNNLPVGNCLQQVRQMAQQAQSAGLNIDYFPTNFVLQEGLLYYIDYECNAYSEQWNFENWGKKYWSRTEEFEDYLRAHQN